MKPFARGGFAPLCASAGRWPACDAPLARHQPSGLPRPVPLGRGPRKVFFATYTPPRKTDWIFLRRCGGANSVRLERGAPGFAGHSSFARLYKASRFRAAARNVFYGKAKRTVQTKRSARFFFVTPVSSSGSAPLRRGRPRGRGWPRGGWCRRWASPCRDCPGWRGCPDCRDCPADPASPGYSPEW